MTNREFKCFKELCESRKQVEEDIQYRGYFFLSLTERQGYIIADTLVNAGFPVVNEPRAFSGKAVELPNGLRLWMKGGENE